ncbi:BglG family transcription antiterminator [Acetonema longum]|uniref:Transcriptional antiterminator n=1 Tax=Acetonema longum DSM 6540 TaxID=1009370 RepID=F7NGA1_9FIRM|nr:BglG family transcription antiterminator [Acetonema longum]EGO65019.1 transcriptional antiterminator [Acetonema longum DSM 6540]
MISRKHAMIIQYLTDKDTYVTADELSLRLEVSVRTIKRYVQDLNYFLYEYGVEIASVKGVGYKLQGPAKELRRIGEEAAKYFEGPLDDSSEGRISKIICALLDRSYTSAEELSDMLNLSIASVNKCMASVKRILREYDLRLAAKPFYGSKIVGEELQLRALMLHYAVKSDGDRLEVKLDTISEQEIKTIEEIITEALIARSIILADKDFNELLARILISVARVRKNGGLEKSKFQEDYRLHNYYLIQDILTRIGRKLAVPMDENEALYVSSSSGIVLYDYNTRMKLTADTQDTINRFVEEALTEVSLATGLDFRGDVNFINALTMHLRISINRFKAGINAKNPLLKQIKAQFPMETSLAALVAKKLQEEFAVVLDEDELGFITMHFGAAVERKKSASGKKVCIICHYGIGTSQLLAEKLKQRISDIHIVGTYPARYLDIALKADIDLIVSTIKLDQKDVKVPVLYIENVFSDEIVNEFHQVFQEQEERKKIFRTVFHREAFVRIAAETPEEAIRNLGRAMQAKGLINEEIITMVLERETMSSTDIGNLVAIPHTISEGACPSVIGVGVLEKPILWRKEEVQLIFMVCFNRKESHNFPLFKHLYSFIRDEGNVRRVIKTFGFEKLLELLDVK